jgi:hypothetical protein
MPNELKIVFFWIAVWFLIMLLRWKSNSVFSRIAFSFHGPAPEVDEKRSLFYWRQTRYALGWLFELLLVSGILFIATGVFPIVGTATTFLAFCSFALFFGVGMALLGAILASLVSAKARFIGPDPEFARAKKYEIEDEEDEENC